MRTQSPLSGIGRFTASLTVLANLCHANFTAVPSPNLDLSSLGRVAVVGNFDSVSVYQYQGQSESSLSSNGSQSLLTRYPDGSFDDIAYADAYIQTMCPFIQSDGSLAGVVVGGNFTSLGGVQTQGIALWNPNTSAITPLPGLSGRVSSLYCDSSSGTVYVGGSFTGGNSTNAIAWVTGWTNLPFSGFNGPVNAITKAPNGNIIFAGDFVGLGNASTPRVANDQSINVASANITAVGTSTTQGFEEPKSIVCQTGQGGAGNTWLLADDTPGSWKASFGFGFNPTLLRLYNTNQDGRGTKTFRFTALPLGGIMNLTYVDSTGLNQSCTSTCPLPQGNTTAQDFHFVNSVGMNAFRIDISAWYGAGGGLSGLELFQDDIFSYAVPSFNEPICNAVSTIGATATSSGPWEISPSGQSTSEYLTAKLNSGASTSDSSLPSVVFKPDIRQSGNYSIHMYTPGCLSDDTCAQRGIVTVTGTMTSGGASIATSLYQTNNYDKYDPIYYGYIDITSDSFRPTVTLTPQAGQAGPLVVVAQRVGFELMSSNGGLNGLFEYNPNEATINTDFSSSAIDSAGLELNEVAYVNALAVIGDNLYVAGNFSAAASPDLNNILSIGTENATALPNGGLNNAIAVLYQNASTLFAGGNFTSTGDNTVKNLNGVAAFSTTTNSWSALGAGVNGTVFAIVPLQVNDSNSETLDGLAITGTFTGVNAFGNDPAFPADGFAIWIPSHSYWLHGSNAQTLYNGQLIAQSNVPGFSPLLAGSLTSQESGNTDIVGLTGSGQPTLQSYDYQLGMSPSNTSSTSITKRDTTTTQTVAGVVIGLYYNENDLNLTILGGNFEGPAMGNTVQNLLIVNNTKQGDTARGLPDTIDTSSTFLAMDTQGTTLFAGGSVTGTIGNNNVNGLIVYDLVKAALVPTQPPALSGDNVTVNVIATQPNNPNVYVGGSFSQAGSLNCETLCYYDTSTAQWNSPGIGLTGTIETMTWASSTQLVIAGNLSVGGNVTTVATYDSKSQTFQTFNGASNLPGPVSVLSPSSSSNSGYWAAGVATNNQSAYLQKYDGSNWVSVGGLGASSNIRALQVMAVTSNHQSSSLVDSDQILLITGALEVPDYGNASAVLFNGSTFQPFILTGSSDSSQTSISRIFVDYPSNLLSASNHKLAVGFVVLIGLAIALFLIFLIVVAGILMERYRRRREGYLPMQQLRADQQANLDRIPPERLIDLMGEKNAAPKI